MDGAGPAGDGDGGGDDPTAVALACYASLADVQGVLQGDPEMRRRCR